MRSSWRHITGGEGEISVSGAVLRFALAGLVAVALVGLASFLLMRRIGTSQATENAGEVTRLIGQGIVEPNLTDALVRGEPAAVARFDRLISSAVLADPIVRVKLWQGSGRLAYSDEPRLIGRRFSLGADELSTLREGAPDSEVSDLAAPENRFERTQGKLLEAYTRVSAPSGEPLLFETYQQYSAVTSSGRSLWLAFAPALVAALILLELIQLPLASSLARRVRNAGRERVRLLEHAVDASNLERRRIAANLHDGAVQDLSGVALSLEVAARRVEAADPTTAGSLRERAEQTRGSVRSLRSLLVEIYPPILHEAGLRAALEDLLAPLDARGIETRLAYDSGVELGLEREALCFRVAQEAVRNTLKHAHARRVEVTLGPAGGGVALTITDEGLGFDPSALPEGERAPGHIGTTLLRDLARESGSDLAIESAPGRGTTVRLTMPSR